MLILGQRSKEVVDRPAQAAAIRDLPDANQPLVNRERPVGRDDVDVVRFERLTILRVMDTERRGPGQQFRHQAVVRGIEVHDDDKAEPRLRRHRAEEPFEGVETAGRGTQAHDGKTAAAHRRRRT